MSIKLRHISGILIGNTIEFYDLVLFGIFAPVMSSLFFPSDNKYLSMTVTFASFAIGFIFRPLGSLYFGQIADKVGRKKALSSSILLMAFATGTMGILPTYSQIGIMAPILIILIRCIQGFAAGGEYNSSAIFLLESVKRSKSLIACLLAASGVIGSLTATLFLNLSIRPTMPSWAWRIAFIAGSTAALLGFYIRLSFAESVGFDEMLKNRKILNNPLLEVLKPNNNKKLLISFIIGSFNGIIYYFQFIYLTTYFNSSLKISLAESNYFNTLGLFFYMIFLFTNGILGNKFGAKKMMSIACLNFVLLIIPIFHFLHVKDNTVIIVCEILLSYMNASFCGLKHVFLAGLFPVNIRCTGVSIGYSLGLAIFGGTTPLFMNFFNSNLSGYLGSIYIMVWAIICFLAINQEFFYSYTFARRIGEILK